MKKVNGVKKNHELIKTWGRKIITNNAVKHWARIEDTKGTSKYHKLNDYKTRFLKKKVM